MQDFIAVADDLVGRGVCTHQSLGCQGGSNGGLLVGNMLTRAPEKFGAIVCQVCVPCAFNLVDARTSAWGQYGLQKDISRQFDNLDYCSVLKQRAGCFCACQVPLLDMQRYHTLLAGASWMAEYGNPDDAEDWEFLRHYSPCKSSSFVTTLPAN